MQDYDSCSLLKTSRLLLRRLSLSDLDIAAEIHGDPATNLHNPSGPRTREQTEHLLQIWSAAWDDKGIGYWTVCDQFAPAVVLGFGGIMHKQIGDVTGLNLYFRLARCAWGKGFAQEMACAALDVAFRTRVEPAVYALVRPANTESRRTIEKIGMRLHSDTQDVAGQLPSLIYRVTLEEYHSRHVKENPLMAGS